MGIVLKSEFDDAFALLPRRTDFALAGPGFPVERPEDRFEKRRFAGAICSVDSDEAGRHLKFQVAKDPIVLERNRRDLHALFRRRIGREVDSGIKVLLARVDEALSIELLDLLCADIGAPP